MKTLLQRAHGSAKQADTFLEFKRPELAYVEYLTAANIIVDLVPRHKDFPSLNTDRGELWRLNKDLQNVRHTFKYSVCSLCLQVSCAVSFELQECLLLNVAL